MKRILRPIRHFFIFGEDKLPEQEIVSLISADVDFHSAQLWLLIIAVFVTSLGLNTNSTAVIIGAMLISPLMGPIIGMGLGVGIYDFTLFRKSIHNYIIATLFSVVTATLYFLVTPITQAQSELLARTSPTIYDVCMGGQNIHILFFLFLFMSFLLHFGSAENPWGVCVNHSKPEHEELYIHHSTQCSSEGFDLGIE